MNLTDHEVDFIKYFIEKYNKNMQNGNISHAHHDCTAVLLLMDEIINLEGRSHVNTTE